MNISRVTVCIMGKSFCCGVSARRFGGRRRQCSRCKATWSVRPRRRGRKPLRQRPQFSYKILREGRTLRGIAETTHIGRERIRRRFHKSLHAFISRMIVVPKNALTKTGPLILITDALFAQCEGEDTMIVPVYLRPVSRNAAVLVTIAVLHGDESEEAWAYALNILSASLTCRIVALVSDDSLGLARHARMRGWIHQRCHFHLAARFRAILGRRKRIRCRKERERAWQLATYIATEPKAYRVGAAIRELQELGRRKELPRFLLFRIHGFLRHWQEYRTYITYPKFRLPATSNIAEAGGSFVRELLRARRGFKTMQSLERWMRTIQLLHPTMTCKRTKIQQN